eukprot:g17963.t1
MNHSQRVYEAWFQIVTGGSIAQFPILLGTPFFAGYKASLSYAVAPPRLKIGKDSFGCCDLPIAMVEIEFISRDAAMGRVVPPSRQMSFFCDPSIHFTAAAAATTAEQKITTHRVELRRPSVMEMMLPNGRTLAVSENLLDGALFVTSGDLMDVNFSSDDDIPRRGGAVAQNANPPSSAGVESYWDRATNSWAQSSVQPHSALGHAKTVELLYEGEALSLLKMIRAECKLCNEWDDSRQILYRGSLLQFATDRNVTWLIDELPTRIGHIVKIIDVWFKAAYKISKLERTNGDDRRHLNKLVHAPLDQWLEILVWGLASHYVDQDFFEYSFEETLQAAAQVRADSDTLPGEYELKQQLVAEMTWQVNNKPILGAALSAENLHSGTFVRGTRDWELQLGEIVLDEKIRDKEVDVFVQRNAIYQEDCRKTISVRDLEMQGRQRELVGRVYFRGTSASCYSVGMRVLVRRPETAKFHRWAEGVVEAIDSESKVVYVRRGQSVTSYPYKDVAVEKKIDGQEYEGEFYPDPEMLDMISDRSDLGETEHIVCPEEVEELAMPSAGPQPTERALRHQARRARLDNLDGHKIKTIHRRGAPYQRPEGETAAAAATPSPQTMTTRPASAFLTYASADHDEVNHEAVVELAPGECLFTRGILHEKVRKEVETFRTSVQMSMKDGKIYLSSAVEVPVPRERAFDFGVLPKVTALMQKRDNKDLQSKLHRGKNDLCFTFSQLLNGRCIKRRMSPKNPGKVPEIHYVVVEANVFHEKARGQTPRGRHCFIRWGDETTPTFVSEEEAKQAVPGTYVARVFFEGVEQALEAVELYTKGLKSSVIVCKMEDAIKLGFASFCYAACILEIQAIDRNGVLGRRAKIKDLKGKNVVTSRWLLVLKIERAAGAFTKAKARWITHGFRDVRYHRGRGEAPSSRCYTVNDLTIVAMLFYLQSIRRMPDLADVAEAFLKGKRMKDLYPLQQDQEVYMKVPEDIIELEVPEVEPLDEAAQLEKELCGQVGAPRGWEEEQWDSNRIAGLVQSCLDPSLWLYFLNQQERLAVEGKYEKKHFAYKLSQIATVPSSDLRRRIEILELHSAPASMNVFSAQHSRSLLNPYSVLLHDQHMPHFQRSEAPAGMTGTHVDDSLSGGSLLFYLRLCCLYDFFGLGSFTRLRTGYRDNFVGRELATAPYDIDQWRVGQYLQKEHDRAELSGLELPEGAVEVPSEEKLVEVEERAGVSRHTNPVEYPLSPSLPLDPAMFLEQEDAEPVVFYVSQQSYASKLQQVTYAEVDKFFQQRAQITSKWARRNLKSPIRVIVEMLGSLASDAHFAEQAERASDIDKFLDELNPLILLAQMPEVNTIRVYRLAGLMEHYLGGAADASKDKIGGITFLAARHAMRLGFLSRFGGGKPGRIFHSSTGIEVLAQKVLASENIYVAQVVFDMHLCRLGRSLLQLTDARNCLTEPKERNLRPDYHSIAMMQREKLIELAHGPGVKMWADGLTKGARLASLFLLHVAANFCLVDKAMYDGGRAEAHREADAHRGRTNA